MTRKLIPIAECQGLAEMWERCVGCCMHAPVFDIADVDQACYRWSGGEYGDAWKDGAKQCTESNSYAVVQLKDGRFGVFLEGEDYTGHGCQCSSATSVHATLDEAVRMGLGGSERDDFEQDDEPEAKT